MGTFSVKLRVWNPAQPGGVEELDAFVDTGAAFSWISRARLERLGVASSRKMGFRTIEGRLLERDMATVYVSTDKYSVPDVVVMAKEGEMEVLGAHTIEGLGMAADPVQKRLVPTVMLARGRVEWSARAGLLRQKMRIYARAGYANHSRAKISDAPVQVLAKGPTMRSFGNIAREMEGLLNCSNFWLQTASGEFTIRSERSCSTKERSWQRKLQVM